MDDVKQVDRYAAVKYLEQVPSKSFVPLARHFSRHRISAEAATEAKQTAEIAARDTMIRQLGENAAKAAKDYAAEIAALRERVAMLEADKDRIDWLQSEMNDVRWIAGQGTEACSPSDEAVIQIVSHHMAEPRERVEAENWNEDLRAAIDEARIDTALKDTTP